MSQRAALAMLDLSHPRTGKVTSYDPNRYAVKVSIQPEDVELAGWMPLGAVAVGNGFGMVSGANIGDVVQVTFDNASPDAPRITGRFFNASAMPPAVPAGDTYIVHKSGSALKFNGDGTVNITAASTITYHAAQHHFIGPVQMDSTLNANGTISGEGGMSISGDNGTGNASTITGNLNTTGTIKNNGHDIGSTHQHINSGGSGLGGVPQ